MNIKTLKKTISMIVLTCAVSMPISAQTELDSVVAVVNDNIITQSQVNAAMYDMRRALESVNATVPNRNVLRKRALDQLIAQDLQLQIAERNEITASDAKLNTSIQNIATQNGITIDQLKQALADEGVEYDKFRTQIRNQMILSELQRALFASKVSVTDQEARNYVRAHPAPKNPNIRYHVDDLLVPVSESAPQADINAARKKAQDLLKQAGKGQAFAVLAESDASIEYSDLDWRTASQLPSIFSKEILLMNKNDIAGPIQAANGFHLLLLKNKQGESRELSMQQAKNIVFQQKLEKRVDSWVDQIRESAYVKILD